MNKTRNFSEIQKYYDVHLQRQVAIRFGVTMSCVANWIKKGKIKTTKTQSESIKLLVSQTPNYGRAKTLEDEVKRKKQISVSMKKNPKCGGYRKGSGRGKKTWYESSIAGKVYLDSSYELAIAKWMDLNGIQWKKNYTKFPYIWNGKTSYYIPDFLLTKTNEYLETKGYFTHKDLEKWKAIPHKLYILFAEDLYKIGLINETRTFDMNDVSRWRVNNINTLGK
jgi:hypothetical protein